MKITKTHTGIFTKITESPETTEESIATWRKLAEHPVTIHSELKEWEREAMAVLRARSVCLS